MAKENKSSHKKSTKTIVEIDEHDPTVIIVNGEKFRPIKQTTKKIDNIVHMDKTIYSKINEDEFKDNLKLLVNTLAKKTNVKELLTEILKNGVGPRALKRIVKQIQEKKPIRKQHGCLGFKIGTSYLQVVE